MVRKSGEKSIHLEAAREKGGRLALEDMEELSFNGFLPRLKTRVSAHKNHEIFRNEI